ncbi:MAG: oxidoreductase [Ruminococcaceae bacterium]|nr:oxidoreductase [Oscillospiraceae bacterium]
MKQTARIISTYAGDTSGVASALFELGGMTVMHDASGCNSTYNTHDEPRWYDTDSLVFISALTETEAILGDDGKLIGDCARAAEELHPRFVAVAGTPIPMMTGVDFDAVAVEIEARTGIPSFGFATDGMHSYVRGAGMAFDALARRMVREPVGKKSGFSLDVNLIGLTPLDFSVYGAPDSMKNALGKRGIGVRSSWAMGSRLDELEDAANASVSLAVSGSGLAAARTLYDRFGIPYVAATPCGERWNDRIADAVRQAAKTGVSKILPSLPTVRETRRLVLGEGLTAASLASALTFETGSAWSALSAVEPDDDLFAAGILSAIDEDDIAPYLADCEIVIADPLYKPIVPENVRFVPLPHEGFSGRLFRHDIPNLTEDLTPFRKDFAL